MISNTYRRNSIDDVPGSREENPPFPTIDRFAGHRQFIMKDKLTESETMLNHMKWFQIETDVP